MSLSRSMKSSSRRSSILKLPKQRQDLQYLNDNNSSTENSPANTLKFKRRVSFAEKKHVKEFCNSVEQGTVWDTTYEEHDLSNLKMPGTSNQEEHNVHIIEKENIVYFNQENDVQFVSNVTTEKDLNVKDNGTKSRDLLFSQTEISVNYNNLNTTSVQDVRMEFTEVASHAVYRNVNCIQNNKLVETLQNSSMELTQPIYSSVDALQNLQQEHNIQRLNSQPKLSNFNVIAIDPNASMELTVAVPSIVKPVDNANKENIPIYSENNRTKRFDNVSMEITTPVLPVPVVLHRLQEPFDNIPMEITAPVPSVSSVLHTLQQPVTNNEIGTCGTVIPVGNKTAIFHDNSMEITSAVRTQTRDTNCQFGNRSTVTEETGFKYDNEKTKVLSMSMEMTEAMNLHSITKSQERKEINRITDASIENDLRKVRSYLDCYETSNNPDKTSMYDNKAMELTEAIRTSPKKISNKTLLTADKTNMYDNEAMEFTEAIRTSPKRAGNKTSLNIDKTNMYDIETMEFTEAIRTSPKKMSNKTLLTADKTNMYDNEAMEFTEAIRTSPKKMSNKTLLNTDKTNMYDIETMEFTEAIRTSTKKMSNKTLLNADKTNMYDNEAMEFTEAIRTSPKKMSNKTLLNADKTNMYDNEAMEFTEAIRTSPKRVGNKTSLNIDKTNMYDIETMEFTEAIRTSPKKMSNKTLLNIDKTNMYDNEAMEFTEAIGTSLKKMDNKKLLIVDKTNMYDNEAMEFTEAIGTSSKQMDNKTLLDADKTNTYDNEAMEFTEAIRISPKNNLTNTEHVQNNQRRNDDEDNGVNLVSNKTTICQNNSMTITNIVSPSSMKNVFKNVTEDHESNINNSELIKTVEYPNMSMNITEDALVLQCHLPRETSVINSACFKEPVLLENEDQDPLDSNVVHGNILKDITDIVVPSLSEANLIIDKKMRLTDDSLQPLKCIATKTSALTEHENSVSSISHTVSLESKQQDADALTSKNNIRRKTYVLHSPKFHNPSISIPEFQSQNIISNPRRTYTIQPLNLDYSCNKENDKTSDNVNNKIKNDSFCYTSIDKASCTRSSLNNTDNLRNNDDEHLIEEDAMFFNNTLEELNTITPPSFVCLEESDSGTLVDADMEVNLNPNSIKNSEATEEENILEDRCNLENKSDIHEETLNVDEVASVQIEQINKDCSEVDLSPRSESHELSEQKDTSIELDPFSSLMNKLKVCAQSDEIIWEVYHENIERNLFVIGFVSSSLLVVIYLKDNFDALGNDLIKEIKIYSRLADDADALISLVHRIIMEKLDAQLLADLCKNCEDVFSILDKISKEVKLAMDFMFDVERMRDINLMEITRDSVSFIAFAKKKDIILRVTVDIKPFHKIESKDISVHCRLGSVREEDVKRLITNIKRDHKFLRRYISDVKDYIYLMEESVNIIKR